MTVQIKMNFVSHERKIINKPIQEVMQSYYAQGYHRDGNIADKVSMSKGDDCVVLWQE